MICCCNFRMMESTERGCYIFVVSVFAIYPDRDVRSTGPFNQGVAKKRTRRRRTFAESYSVVTLASCTTLRLNLSFVINFLTRLCALTPCFGLNKIHFTALAFTIHSAQLYSMLDPQIHQIRSARTLLSTAPLIGTPLAAWL